MTDTQIEVTLTNHENQIKSLKHRMDKAEKNDEKQSEILLAVKELAINMSHMAEEQKRQGERLEKLEDGPAEDHKYYKRTVVACVITTAVGAIVGAIMMLAMNGGIS